MALIFTIGNLDDFDVPPQKFEWDFDDGDGEARKATTTVPFAAHNYAPALGRGARSHIAPRVRVTASEPSASGALTVLIFGSGFIEMPLSLSAGERGEGALDAILRMPPPTEVLTFSLVKEEVYCDSRRTPGLTPVALSPATSTGHSNLQTRNIAAGPSTEITVEPGKQWQATLSVGISEKGRVCAVAVHQTGTTPAGIPVRGHAYFPLANLGAPTPSPSPSPLPRKLSLFLETLGTWNLTPVPDEITLEDLAVLVDMQLIKRSKGEWMLTSTGFAYIRNKKLFPNSKAKGTCTDPSPGPAYQCRPTEDWYYAPGRATNAHKGDTILTSGCGLISTMLQNLGQEFSHTALVARDGDQIVQGFAVTGRYRAYVSLGQKAISPPEVLKYGWNGRHPQPVDEALYGDLVAGELMKGKETYPPEAPFDPDPDGCMGGAQVIRQLVVRPPLAVEMTPFGAKHRQRLQDVADSAMGEKAHYRLNAYSRAGISLDPNKYAGKDCDWCEGSFGAMCSSFIWTVFTKNKMRLGHKEHPYGTYKVDVDASTPDGLFHYPEAYRKYGVQQMRTAVFNGIAYGDVFGFIGAVVGVADGIADQVTNCFVSDSCKTVPGHEKDWQDPGEGYTVSPQDILHWDPVSEAGPGGPYGDSAPLKYVPGRYVQIYKWVK
jgi:hypothetical protein